MIVYIKRFVLFIFDLIHIYYHQKSIAFYLKNKMSKIDNLLRKFSVDRILSRPHHHNHNKSD